jgi:hypothetical protein
VVGLPLDEVLAVLRDVGLANHGTTGRV